MIFLTRTVTSGTKSDAAVKRVHEQGDVIGFSVFGVSRFQKGHPPEAELVEGA